jgi:hypothetical protein
LFYHIEKNRWVKLSTLPLYDAKILIYLRQIVIYIP